MAKFIDKGSEALEYTMYDIIYSLFIATLTAVGGYLVENYGGFEVLFLVAGTVPILGGIVALRLLHVKRIKHEYK